MFHNPIQSQEIVSSEEALNLFNDISRAMNLAHPEDDIKTFQKLTYSESQLETYLSPTFSAYGFDSSHRRSSQA